MIAFEAVGKGAAKQNALEHDYFCDQCARHSKLLAKLGPKFMFSDAYLGLSCIPSAGAEQISMQLLAEDVK